MVVKRACSHEIERITFYIILVLFLGLLCVLYEIDIVLWVVGVGVELQGIGSRLEVVIELICFGVDVLTILILLLENLLLCEGIGYESLRKFCNSKRQSTNARQRTKESTTGHNTSRGGSKLCASRSPKRASSEEAHTYTRDHCTAAKEGKAFFTVEEVLDIFLCVPCPVGF